MKVLMSIKPKFVEEIFSETKTFELRKKIFKSSINAIVIYSSSPKKKVVGEIIIDKIISSTPKLLWKSYKNNLGISEKEYFKYYKNSKVAYAIKIKKVIKYKKELELKDFGIEKAPQSYQYINWKEQTMETNKIIKNEEINIIKRAVVEQIEELYNKLILKKKAS